MMFLLSLGWICVLSVLLSSLPRSHASMLPASALSSLPRLPASMFPVVLSLLLSSLPSFDASLFPGLPVPIDSVSLCCSWWSMLPRDKLIFTQPDSSVWEYDSIEQEARRLYHVRQLFSPPVGAGFFSTQDWTNIRFNATTWWSEADTMYGFSGVKYWSATHTTNPMD